MIHIVKQYMILFILLPLFLSVSWSDEKVQKDEVIPKEKIPVPVYRTDKPMTLEMQANKKIYQPCEPIILSVTARNISDATINVWTAKSDYSIGFLFGVYNQRKRKVSSFTNYANEVYKSYYDSFSAYPGYSMVVIDGKTINALPVLSPRVMTIPPHESFSRQYVMNRLYDMTSSGEYILSCSCTLNETKASRSYILLETPPQKIQIVETPNKRLINPNSIGDMLKAEAKAASASAEIQAASQQILDATKDSIIP